MSTIDAGFIPAEGDLGPGPGPETEGPPETAGQNRDGERRARARPRERRADRDALRAVRLLRLQARQRELLARLLGLRGYSDRDEADVARLLAGAGEAGNVARVLARLAEVAGCQDPLEAGALATELALDKQALGIAWAAVGEGPVPGTRPGLALALAVRSAAPAVLGDIKALGGALS